VQHQIGQLVDLDLEEVLVQCDAQQAALHERLRRRFLQPVIEQ
jgi:hypothetical protein